LNVYVDSSVVVRLVLGQPGQLAEWASIEMAISSELTRVECMRTIDRTARRAQLDVETVAERRSAALELLSRFIMIPISTAIVDRAADPFPTTLGSLDAIHLASAIEARRELGPLTMATHDAELALAAVSMGFEVVGA